MTNHVAQELNSGQGYVKMAVPRNAKSRILEKRYPVT